MSLSSSFAGHRSSSRLVRQTVCSLCTVAVLAILLAGCVHAPKPPIAAAPSPVSKAEQSRRTPIPLPNPDAAAERDLAEGIDLYDLGDFNAAIKKLGSSAEIASASTPVQTKALKYLAFSYCVTNRTTLCRTQFEKAVKLNPAFDLEPGEKGHPQWGPVFNRVKKQAVQNK
jgi:hypothetical protein